MTLSRYGNIGEDTSRAMILLIAAAFLFGYAWYLLSMNTPSGEFCLKPQYRLQTSTESCGFAALAMYLSVQGCQSTEKEIIAYFGRNDWMSFAEMLEYCQYRGLIGRGLQIEPSFFIEHSMLSILHLHGDHYVVFLADLPGKNVLVFDPAIGYQTQSSSKLINQMTGYVFYATR